MRVKGLDDGAHLTGSEVHRIPMGGYGFDLNRVAIHPCTEVVVHILAVGHVRDSVIGRGHFYRLPGAIVLCQELLGALDACRARSKL